MCLSIRTRRGGLRGCWRDDAMACAPSDSQSQRPGLDLGEISSILSVLGNARLYVYILSHAGRKLLQFRQSEGSQFTPDSAVKMMTIALIHRPEMHTAVYYTCRVHTCTLGWCCRCTYNVVTGTGTYNTIQLHSTHRHTAQLQWHPDKLPASSSAAVMAF